EDLGAVGGGDGGHYDVSLLQRGGGAVVQAASTRTISASSLAVMRNNVSPMMAAPSRASRCTPLISTEPLARTSYAWRLASIGYSVDSPAFSVASEIRASVRIGSASVSSEKPLASVTNWPERSLLGKGLAPHEGFSPCVFGSIQIWTIRVVPGCFL